MGKCRLVSPQELSMKNCLIVAVAILLVACATSPTGRNTIKLFPSSQMNEMGAAAYLQTKQDTPVSKDGRANAYVACVANQMTRLVGGDWEVTVFADDAANAFALPGGKIGVFTGLLEVAETQDQLAAVIGHEIAHVQAEHSNERVSTNYIAQAGMSVVQAVAGAYGADQQGTMMGLLGLGAQYGVLLPFGRAQESEADVLGLALMARAGFDPRDSVRLWENMAKAGGGQPPEFLSTHPSHSTRIADLNRGIPQVMPDYQAAQQAGRRPNCRR